MFTRTRTARRTPTGVAAHRVVSAAVLAIVLALGVVIAHSTGAGPAHGMATSAAQSNPLVAENDGATMPVAVADSQQAHMGCLTCGDHPEGAMAACLMLLIAVVMVAARFARRASWQTRVPLNRRTFVRQIHRHVPAPDLTVLSVCRT